MTRTRIYGVTCVAIVLTVLYIHSTYRSTTWDSDRAEKILSRVSRIVSRADQLGNSIQDMDQAIQSNQKKTWDLVKELASQKREKAIALNAKADRVNHVDNAAIPVDPITPIKLNNNVSSSSFVVPPNILEMRRMAHATNVHQFIVNEDQFPLGNLSRSDLIVLIVMVHNKLDYLKVLVHSLRSVHGISKAILIVSQDMPSTELDTLLATDLTFMPYIRIFFEKAMSLYPNEFPGQSHRDCPRDISKTAAVKASCINAESPDAYGHYR